MFSNCPVSISRIDFKVKPITGGSNQEHGQCKPMMIRNPKSKTSTKIFFDIFSLAYFFRDGLVQHNSHEIRTYTHTHTVISLFLTLLFRSDFIW
ncbi:hypothetical protein L1987_08619 [Smallanthus sonchifolius]|uniref:Uncharacterized protein n=1 Tax=Smallanthus sonchifolius TaxID=185202 RepID=A0ACB9JKN9_9ASTR|nr:hypothetical protein L1987_08619 [Smallanthus sonchifolius]